MRYGRRSYGRRGRRRVGGYSRRRVLRRRIGYRM